MCFTGQRGNGAAGRVRHAQRARRILAFATGAVVKRVRAHDVTQLVFGGRGAGLGERRDGREV